MLVKNLKVSVHAEPETVWKLLLDRVRNPEDYVPGVSDAHIIEESGNILVRHLRLRDAPVREKITINEHDAEISHEYLEHPSFSGVITSKVLRTARQSPVAPTDLEYRVNIRPRSLVVEGVVRGEEETIADLEAEMQHLKFRAEGETE